jgi:hypothetical protein
VCILEKQAVQKAAEYHKLQIQNKSLKIKLKELENSEVSNLSKLLADSNRRLDDFAILLEREKVSNEKIVAKKDKEISNFKQKYAKLLKAMKDMKHPAIKDTKVYSILTVKAASKGAIVSKDVKTQKAKGHTPASILSNSVPIVESRTPKSSRVQTPENFEHFEGNAIDDYEDLENDDDALPSQEIETCSFENSGEPLDSGLALESLRIASLVNESEDLIPKEKEQVTKGNIYKPQMNTFISE